MPLSSATPRSSNWIPEPATRSLTVLETSTSPGSAWDATRAPVDCDARNLAVDELAFTGVQAGAHVEAETADRLRDRTRAADRTRGAVERREEAVAGSVDLDTAITRELSTHELVVLLEQLAPPAVPDRRGVFAR